MPTEKRSSNTELSKIVTEALVGMVSGVTGMKPPADEPLPGFIQAPIDRAVTRISGLLAHPDPQPHPEPIAWMVGTAFWWTKEETERDAAETGLPIVGMGPMTGIALAEPHQGEPVGEIVAFGKGLHEIAWAAGRMPKLGAKLYTSADPGEVERFVAANTEYARRHLELNGEVERLRAALKFYADREHYHFESGNWDTVSGEPLNILWHGEEPDFIENGSVARAALEHQP